MEIDATWWLKQCGPTWDEEEEVEKEGYVVGNLKKFLVSKQLRRMSRIDLNVFVN
jgi:hypothetical protein